jgi:hypothetical protein
VAADLTVSDLKEILKSIDAPKLIDYLSFDVDEASEIVLAKLPLNDYVFRFVTFEHNAYLDDPCYRTLKTNARKKFTDNGYSLLIENVMLENHGAVEDWYVHDQTTMSLRKIILQNINHRSILTEYKFL